MKTLCLLFVFWVVAPSAFAAQTETFNTYLNTRPSATQPANGVDKLLLNQGGVTKQIPVSGLGAASLTAPNTFTQPQTMPDIIAKGPWVDARSVAIGDGVNNDSAALQSIANSIVASGRFTWIDLAGRTYKMNSGFTQRCDLVGVRNGKLDFSGMVSGTAYTVTGSGTGSPYYQNRTVMENVELAGPGKTLGANGVVFNTASESGTSHIGLIGVNVHGFQVGNLYQNNAYAVTSINCDIWDCGTCVSMPSGQTNSGERLTYIGSTFYNSDLALNIASGNASFHMLDCSIDYNGAIATINGGRIFLTDCHVEALDYPLGAPIYVSGNGGTFKMEGGWLLLTAANGTHVMPSMVDCETTAGGGGGAWFDKVFMHNLGGTSGYFAIGAGDVAVRDTSSYDISYNPAVLSAASNKVADGSFESAVIRDWIFIANDTAAPSNRFTGANVSVALSNLYAHTGAQSLSVSKTFNSGSQATVRIAIPIRPGARAGFRLYYKKPGTQAGTMYLAWFYGTYKGTNASGVPVFDTPGLNSTTATFTSSPVDWTAWQYFPALGASKVPPEATHLILDLNCNNMDAGAVYFDDLTVTEM